MIITPLTEAELEYLRTGSAKELTPPPVKHRRNGRRDAVHQGGEGMSTVTIPASGGEDAHTVFIDPGHPDADGIVIPESICIDSTVDLSREQAGEMGWQLIRLSRQLYPASELGLSTLTVALDAINDARGTSHTLESVAASLGMERPLSEAEADDIARHIGGVLMT